MSHHRRTTALITPSVFSLIFGTVSVFTVLGVVVWDSIKSTTEISQTISSLDSQISAISETNGIMNALDSSFLSSNIVNQFFYIAAWALVGVLLYFCVVILSVGTHGLSGVFHGRDQVDHNRFARVSEAVSRTLFRVFMGIVLLVTMVLFARFLLPISISSIQAGSSLSSIEDAWFILLAVLVMSLSVHLIVIFMRLFLIKLRVFGGVDELILSE